MPFLAPFAPMIATGVGSLFGSKLIGGSGGIGKDKTKQALDAQTQSITQGNEIAAGIQPHAKNLLDLATRSYSPVADYFSSILSGNRGSAMQTLAPEAGRISDAYQAAGDTSSNLMPRGGGRSAFFADQPFHQQRDTAGLLSTARPQAASGLLQTGNAAAGAGNSTFATILNALSGGRSGGQNLLNFDIQDKAAQYDKGKDIGKTIFDMLQQFKGGFKKSGGGGGSGSGGGILGEYP